MKSRGQIRFIISVFFLHCHYSGISVSYFDELKIIGIDNLGLSDNEQSQPPSGVLSKRCSENMQQMYRRTPLPKCDFNKVAKRLYWNHTLAWVFSCKFAACFENTFSKNTSGWLLLNEINQLLLNGHSN